MTDLASISAALSSIKTATDIVKAIKKSDTSLKDAEVNFKLAELFGSLADAKIEIAEIQVLLNSKDNEIEELQEQLTVKKNMTWDSPYYWFGPKENSDGPYCQNCYDDKTKLIRLQEEVTGYWTCTVCDNSYEDSNYNPPNVDLPSRRRYKF